MDCVSFFFEKSSLTLIRERKKEVDCVSFFFLKSRVWSLFEREREKCQKGGPVCPRCPHPRFNGPFLDMAVSLCPSKDVQYVHTRKKGGLDIVDRLVRPFDTSFLSQKWTALVFFFEKSSLIFIWERNKEVSKSRSSLSTMSRPRFLRLLFGHGGFPMSVQRCPVCPYSKKKNRVWTSWTDWTNLLTLLFE